MLQGLSQDQHLPQIADHRCYVSLVMVDLVVLPSLDQGISLAVQSVEQAGSEHLVTSVLVLPQPHLMHGQAHFTQEPAGTAVSVPQALVVLGHPVPCWRHRQDRSMCSLRCGCDCRLAMPLLVVAEPAGLAEVTVERCAAAVEVEVEAISFSSFNRSRTRLMSWYLLPEEMADCQSMPAVEVVAVVAAVTL